MSEMRCRLCGRPIQNIQDEKVCACGNVVRRRPQFRNLPPGPNNKDRVRERGKIQRTEIMTRNNGFGFCHWCKREVVCVASIPIQDRVSVGHTSVRWKLNGQVRLDLVATTDHVTAVADGGKNGVNIVVSCATCNNARKSEKAKRLEAEAARNNNVARKQLHWLLKVGANVSFGKPVSIEIRHDGEVVVQVTNGSFDAAVNQAMNLYGRWCMECLGKPEIIEGVSEGPK